MKKDIETKLTTISDIWNNYIWEYQVCNHKIKFTKDIQSNYFGDILFYFTDTLDVIFKPKEVESFTTFTLCNKMFLKAIYIQQDFIEELLYIFRCNIDKGELSKNDNYKINRDLRNELVGHPIRKSNFTEHLEIVRHIVARLKHCRRTPAHIVGLLLLNLGVFFLILLGRN